MSESPPAVYAIGHTAGARHVSVRSGKDVGHYTVEMVHLGGCSYLKRGRYGIPHRPVDDLDLSRAYVERRIVGSDGRRLLWAPITHCTRCRPCSARPAFGLDMRSCSECSSA